MLRNVLLVNLVWYLNKQDTVTFTYADEYYNATVEQIYKSGPTPWWLMSLLKCAQLHSEYLKISLMNEIGTFWS